MDRRDHRTPREEASSGHQDLAAPPISDRAAAPFLMKVFDPARYPLASRVGNAV
ncbi:hypothetical protein SK854_06195 [Lentzea sp. BCCO 10_0061]|uniref:Uncharacterized protein n=1 Tax=Lentzea sokolovensis TaxID=3095429 RepID=A0ABU4UR99_9PSEU|nr:hypothetical protein [Lentzea sp. BCCO 10_0061]MDX8141692.1 hypothetical protein [Lentzea sp. BCCO 10_0061]